MSHYVPDALKETVFKRAKSCCEYCLTHADDALFTMQIDHIISLKHGGATSSNNLALSCIFCNRNKGSDIGSILLPNRKFHSFFNPRIHQ